MMEPLSLLTNIRLTVPKNLRGKMLAYFTLRHDIQHNNTKHKGLICDTHHNSTSGFVLSVNLMKVAFIYCYAECCGAILPYRQRGRHFLTLTPGACGTKLSTSVINSVAYLACGFVGVCHLFSTVRG